MPCTTPMTMATLTALKIMTSQFISDWHRCARVAEARPRQTVERGHILRHFVEQTFNRQETVLTSDVIDQIMQKFPFRAGVAGRLEGLHEFLDTALDARERAAFFNVRAAGQDKVRQLP